MKHVRAVLFDAGGTLIHPDGARICSAAGVPYEPAAFRRAEAGAVAAVRRFILERPESRDAERVPLYFGTLVGNLGVAGDAERGLAAARVGDAHRQANLWSCAADDAAATLSGLKARGYRLAVISNADGRVRGLLETAGLTPLLEFVVDSAEMGIEKPDPRIFHAATDRLGLSPAACAYVGDVYEIDVLGAEGAGLTGILVGEGPAPASVRRVPTLSALDALFSGFA
ncbi:MAG TPA: HAD-IA family hydrolase [Thermoanaerobaculia bacterium]|nr:HAD-IA family hydrolase [Thermoanaerobaculia bacterium]